jgi:hypothetical protein
MIQALVVGLKCPPLPSLTESITVSSLFAALFAPSSTQPVSLSAKRQVEAFQALVLSKVAPRPHQVAAFLSTTLKGKLLSAMKAKNSSQTRDKSSASGSSKKGFSSTSAPPPSSGPAKSGSAIGLGDIAGLMSALTTLKMAPTAAFLSEVRLDSSADG